MGGQTRGSARTGQRQPWIGVLSAHDLMDAFAEAADRGVRPSGIQRPGDRGGDDTLAAIVPSEP
jgi:hypothetical protein